MLWIVLFCPPSFVLVNCGIAPVLSSYRFEFWVPIELHLLGMHILILSLNGALPLYNTIGETGYGCHTFYITDVFRNIVITADIRLLLCLNNL